MIGINVGKITFKIGAASFFISFFDTITYHLENKNRGSVYKNIYKLYNGHIENEALAELKLELLDVREQLKAFPPSSVIWDMNDLSKKPPWGNNISERITSLANYYGTADGAEDLFEVIFRAIDKATELKENMEIK